MTRVKRGKIATKKRRKILKLTKGFRWGRKSKERAAKEAHYVEQLLAGIAKGSAIAYGTHEVETAAHAGAITTLLVTDGLISRTRAEGTFPVIDSILKTVDTAKGTIIIVSSTHDAGKKLDGLGGIAALLRYRLT